MGGPEVLLSPSVESSGEGRRRGRRERRDGRGRGERREGRKSELKEYLVLPAS